MKRTGNVRETKDVGYVLYISIFSNGENEDIPLSILRDTSTDFEQRSTIL